MSRTLGLLTCCLGLLAHANEPGSDRPRRIELTVGEEVSVGYITAPICDAPRIAVLSAEGNGVIKAVGVGTTLCSGETPVGLRQVFEVVVKKADGKSPSSASEKGSPATAPTF